ncbi:hypothetical protein TVAG_012250 [Trichomonas vaginalis G3]|uniref:Uncharacterized protein n=1 Tax=Trichomonas vaginalis (strain ATCC PRA-98 / G3) TaxID=412133 RepID=A2E8X5_TRIV3|nr:uncharacterized protein TVAGG3_1074730 [Trichomonas vaginalis G3]EAY10859.1 hypothetical protein TVAG_012250 [Trichomonas vaginalis G3]KAI5482907.1 hypothetical protein TVAGG3_1074730 [Trichomonas vaginalis G3]|eukprot:XP_001323082.1 hypothetical protein [Trichomonas vaginalis G3]
MSDENGASFYGADYNHRFQQRYPNSQRRGVDVKAKSQKFVELTNTMKIFQKEEIEKVRTELLRDVENLESNLHNSLIKLNFVCQQEKS